MLWEFDQTVWKSSELEENEIYSTSSPYVIENFSGLDVEIHTLFGSKKTYEIWNGQHCKISTAEKQINSEFIIYEDSKLDYTEM